MERVDFQQPLTCAWCRLRAYPQYAVYRYHEGVRIPLHASCEEAYLKQGKYEGFNTGRTREHSGQYAPRIYKRSQQRYKVIR